MNAHPLHETPREPRAGGAPDTVEGGHADSLRPDDRRSAAGPDDAPERTPASGPLLFVPFLVLMLVGFWLMSVAFDMASAWLFGAGIVVAGLAFLIPLQARD